MFEEGDADFFEFRFEIIIAAGAATGKADAALAGVESVLAAVFPIGADAGAEEAGNAGVVEMSDDAGQIFLGFD